MRPVLLELAGFASFRDAQTVDFTGADYFALVGPTGSGKSTVIDAITFALYGSVPRWDDRRTVGWALAPTVARGAVRFVFDVGEQRYVVARELRRAASGGVSVRSARLERLVDPAGRGTLDEDTEPLADGAVATTGAVERLLGLPFADFCTCVVLPQGEFAEFLHTEPRKRQEKLVRILGLGIYDVIAKAANSEAARQRARGGLLTEQLAGYADATAEAERAAASRVAELTGLATRVRSAVPRLTAAAEQLRAALVAAEQARADRAALRALTVPDGVDRLHARERAAADRTRLAGERAAVAEQADEAARRRLAAAPERGRLEQLRRDHAELAAGRAELPGLRERGEKAHADYELAVRDASDARQAAERTRADRDRAAEVLGDARADLDRLVAERDGLRQVTPPPGLDDLDRRRVTAATALARADRGLAAAEATDTQARAVLAAAPERGPLERARRDLRDLLAVAPRLRAALTGRADADRALGPAAAAVAAARHRVEHARTERAARQRRDLAAALRPELATGEDCPVCAQPVRSLPAPVPASTDREGADRAVARAEQELEEARRGEAAAVAERVRVVEAAAGLAGTAQRLWAELAGAVQVALAVTPPDPAVPDPAVPGPSVTVRDEAVDAGEPPGSASAVPQVHECTSRSTHADLAPGTGGVRVGVAPPAGGPLPVRRLQILLGELAVAFAAARAAVPAADRVDAGPRTGGPGVERAPGRSTGEPGQLELPIADPPRTGADGAQPAFPPAGTGTTGIPEAVLAELGAAVDALLAALEELGRAAEVADAAVRSARRDRATAADAAGGIQRELVAAAAELRAARDPLVAIGAPAVPGDEVGDGWTTLVRWARAEAVARETAIGPAREALHAAGSGLDLADRALAAAGRVVEARRAAETAAARAEQEARDAVAATERRSAQLRAVLDGAPSDVEAAAALDRRAELEEAAAGAAAGLHAARAEQRAADDAATEVGNQLAAAWRGLRAARDPLVALDAPALTDTDLRAAWTTLAGWAGKRAERSDRELAAAETLAATVREERDTAERSLCADLAAHGLPAAPADQALALVAAARERAGGEQRRVAERRAAAAAVTAERDAAESEQQVARMLGGLLRSDGFPRWLVASALDALVVDASASLVELSGGQFELTHADGEFLVIDHADADSRRPVKTLSGGETFQASLALALALSAQMSALAAHGGARLESIFIDEGFGSLDQDNLETVAGTLENLAARGDRVVGIITHVPALAERVPVRYAVSRDERTSRVVREGP